MAGNGLILNRYRPIAEAGAGGFGTVRVAWDTRIQRKVAIKCIELDEVDAARAALPGANAVELPRDHATVGELPPWEDTPYEDDVPPWEDLPEVPDFESPFRKRDQERAAHAIHDDEPIAVRSLAHIPGLDEARTAAMLTDPNIVAVYDFEVQDRTAYLIMEYIEGLTLTQLLRDHAATLTLDVVAAIFSSIAHALEVAHDNQVLHLDIKPDNVLINRQGQVKVTDFGLATLADASGFGAAGGGTIGYMPLEQMRGENLDARCDEWALASVTYEMLAGNNPFVAPDLEKAEAAIVDAELVLPSLCWDDLDPEADDVVFYALDPDRELRYDNVTDFAEEMEKFFGDSKRGHRELAVIVGNAEADDEEESEEPCEPPAPRTPLRDRIGPIQIKLVAHTVGALGSALVAFVSLANMPFVSGWTNPLFWGLFALVTLAGALKPHLGALLAFFALAISLVANEAYAVGFLLVAATAAWWFFFGRFGNAPANTALSVPLAGAVGGSQLAPMFAGLTLSPLSAAATTVFAFFVTLILAGFGSSNLLIWNPLSFWEFGPVDVQANILQLLVKPETWCLACSWVLAALVQALCRLRVTRLFDVLGALLAFAFLGLGACAVAWFGSSQTTWIPPLLLLVSTLVSGILGVILSTQLPCVRTSDLESYEEYDESEV